MIEQILFNEFELWMFKNIQIYSSLEKKGYLVVEADEYWEHNLRRHISVKIDRMLLNLSPDFKSQIAVCNRIVRNAHSLMYRSQGSTYILR